MDRDPSQSEIDEVTRRDLTRFADGSLQGHARAELEVRLGDSPGLRAALERQRVGAAALRGLDLRAPASLKTRLAAAAGTPARRGRRRRFTFAGALAGAAAAAALAAALILPIGSENPTVPDAAQLAERPATGDVAVDPETGDPAVSTRHPYRPFAYAYVAIFVALFVWFWPLLVGSQISDALWRVHIWLPSWN